MFSTLKDFFILLFLTLNITSIETYHSTPSNIAAPSCSWTKLKSNGMALNVIYIVIFFLNQTGSNQTEIECYGSKCYGANCYFFLEADGPEPDWNRMLWCQPLYCKMSLKTFIIPGIFLILIHFDFTLWCDSDRNDKTRWRK